MRQLRMAFVVLALVAVFAVYQAATSPAQAQSVLGSLSFPLWSERPITAKAGINQLVTFCTSDGTAVKAFYKSGFLVLPKDRYGVFSDLSVMRVDPLVLGIQPEHIKDIKTEADCGASMDNGSVVVKIAELNPDLYDVITMVKQDQGRVDESGVIPIVLQVFGRKKHHQVMSTDVMAGTFGVVDANRYIEMFCKYQLDITADKMTDEQKYLVKSVYFDSRLKGVMEFCEAVADYSWLSQGLALKLQGFKPPMADGQQQEDPVVAAYKQQNEELKKLIELLQTEKSDRDCAEAVKPKRWSVHVGVSPTGSWAVWGDGANQPVRVTDETIRFTSKTGIRWVEIVPWTHSFRSWNRYDVTAGGQQFGEVH